MTRPIDADALIKKWENVQSKDISFAMAIIGAINDVKKAPTIDAVPVIRCRVCLKKRICSLYREANQENGFCAWGAKEEE